MRKRLFFLFKCLLSGGLLFYLFRKIDFRLLWETFSAVSFPFLLCALGVLFLFHASSAWRWMMVGKYLSLPQSFGFFLKVYLIGVYFNTFLPGILGGDLVRVFYLVREGAGKLLASASIVYDRGFGLLAAVCLLLLFLPFEGAFLPLSLRHALYGLSGGILVGVGVLLLALRPLQKRISHDLFLLIISVAPLKRFFTLLLLGFLVQTLYVIHVVFLAFSLGVKLSPVKFFLIVPVIGVLASLPISLGGLGIREGAFVYFLGLLGYPREVGIALGFLVYGVNLFLGLVGLLVYLRSSTPSREELQMVR